LLAQILAGRGRSSPTVDPAPFRGVLDVHESTSGELHLEGVSNEAHVMLYAGERQRTPIVMHGPVVGETRADLMRASQAYMQGKLPRVSEL
jgi:redox-sensitive bicupin YhaK (pirin superfamily)